ncbi:MAG: TatD family hydrolase [Chloroflexi bacterium]|nr:TatD family hydrolase [Chloroflexota bacterium]
MRYVDPHIHMYTRTTDDYQAMALAGIESVVDPAFWLGSARHYAGTFFDYYEHLLGYEAQRAADYGIQHHCALSVNPREANDLALANEVLERLPEFLDRPNCVAIGEIGFDRATEAEEEVLRKQLRLARDRGLLAIVHTPHQYKKIGVERILRIVQEEGVDPERMVIDHNTEETMPLYAGLGYWRALTVYPVTKLSPERAANIVRQYGTERLLVNSSADWGPSDVLSVPRTATLLLKLGVSREQVEQLVFWNPLRFFAQTPKFKLPGDVSRASLGLGERLPA